MPRRPVLGSRLHTLLFWAVGIGLTSWSYMWRTTPLHRSELLGSPERDAPPAIASGVDLEGVQRPQDGVGPLFHRRFVARIRDARLTAEELTAQVTADPDRVAPTEFVHFHKVVGREGEMRLGDEFVVRMPGPWNGPVRVISVTPTSFRLATLRGHLEAGQVEFRAVDDGDLQVSVETWANSGDRISHLLYQHLRMAKEVQFHMWTSLLERTVRLAGGRLYDGIEVVTRQVDDPHGMRLGHPRARMLLDDLHHRAVNFDPAERDRLTRENGWIVDHYRSSLPSEPPGPPVHGGSWEVARELIRNYEFADPSIIRAVYQPEHPLVDRDMLLEARFHGLRFHFGVRVGGVRDEVAEVNGQRVQVWGWNYSTLQGHLEEGQMDFEVWKWLHSGRVEFHTRRFARRADIRNPVVRVGFRLFGRREQVRFALQACDRMARLTAAVLEDEAAALPLSSVADAIQVRPIAGSGATLSSE